MSPGTPLIAPHVSAARLESNRWLRRHAATIEGDVLSIGSGNDSDGQGATYREYFIHARSYTTSDANPAFDCNLALDVRNMSTLSDNSFDAVFCSGVLEHVNDPWSGISEIARVLAPGGVLLLGLPFRHPLHHVPHDYWRFTEYGVRALIEPYFAIKEICVIDETVTGFPSAYWTRAIRV